MPAYPVKTDWPHCNAAIKRAADNGRTQSNLVAAQIARLQPLMNRAIPPEAEMASVKAVVRYWITLPARSIIDCGIVMPSALAVFKLIASSNFVGC